MITLAVLTGIPMQSWADAGARACETAFDVLAEIKAAREGRSTGKDDGRVYSG